MGSIIPISTSTRTAGAPIVSRIGGYPGLAISPDGLTEYVADNSNNTIIPIDLTTGTVGAPIQDLVTNSSSVITFGDNLAISPDGSTGYVASPDGGTVVPLDLLTHTPRKKITVGRPIKVGFQPSPMAITPDGKTLYVVNIGENTMTPITLATRRVLPKIKIGSDPVAIAITPDGKTAYVTDAASNFVTPISLATSTPGTPIKVGAFPFAIVIAPDGKTAYVANGGGGSVTPIADRDEHGRRNDKSHSYVEVPRPAEHRDRAGRQDAVRHPPGREPRGPRRYGHGQGGHTDPDRPGAPERNLLRRRDVARRGARRPPGGHAVSGGLRNPDRVRRLRVGGAHEPDRVLQVELR